MAYDEDLGDRIRTVVGREPGVTEKRMFGGLAFLVDGRMAAAAGSDGGMMLRVPPEETEALLRKPEARRFEMRGRELNGWLQVDTSLLESDEELRRWVGRGVAYARSLGPK